MEIKKPFVASLLFVILAYAALTGLLFWIVRDDWSETQISSDPVNKDYSMIPKEDFFELTQSFVAQVERLKEIVVYVDLRSVDEPEKIIKASIIDQSGALAESSASTKEIRADGTLVFEFPKLIEVKRGNQYVLSLSGESGVVIWYGTTSSAGKYSVEAETEQKLAFQGEQMQGELVYRIVGINQLPYMRYYWPVMLLLGLVLVSVILYAHSSRIHQRPNIITRGADLVKQFSYLLKTLVVRDFKVRYKASVLGVFWSFLNPLLMTFVYLFVFSMLFRSSIPNFPVYLLSGIVIYNYFSEATNMGMQSIVGNASLLKKVYIPKYIFPISKALSSAINFAISLIPLLIMMAVTGVAFHKSLLLIPILICFVVIFCIGVSLILSACLVYFRDTQFIWGIMLTIWNFFSPIFYPESIIPARFIHLYHLNPLYQFLFFMRTITIGGISPTPITYLYCIIASFGTLLVGLYVFKKAQNNFVFHL